MTATTNSRQPARRNLAPAITSAIVHLHKGKPVTDTLTISREFLRRHDNVLQTLDSLIADGTISALEFKVADYQDAQGKKRRMIQLSEAGALVAMPFIGGRNSRAGQRRLVDAFMALRADLAAQQSGDWSESRRKVATGFLLVCDTLKEVRADQGKETAQHHYATEAKLINWVLFGRFESVDREGMAQADIKLMDQVEARDVFLIARGRTYNERKAALSGYLLSIRAKQGRIAQ
jgi:Rha family phage regulatory protein